MKDSLVNMNAFILAGGHSRRFGGDKALHLYRGKPLISYTAERLSNAFNHLSLIVKDRSTYSDLGYPVLTDLLSYQTPLAGLYTGLCYTDTEWNFFLACDMPLMTVEVIERLASALPADSGDLEIIIPKTTQGLQPLAAIYHRSLANHFVETVEKVHSVKDFIRSRNTEIMDFESDKPFTNVNTREELQRIDR